MPVCPTCSAQLDSNARFCPKDGTTVRPDSGLIPVQPAQPPQTPRRAARRSTATTDPAADPMIGRLLDSRYRIRGRLGQGGVGAVYEAEHVQIKKTVAVKVLHPVFASTDEYRKRFEREARAISRLSHPACVSVMDFGRVEKVEPADEKLLGTPYLVMELVRGTVLLDRLIDGPPIAPVEAVAVARDLLAALRHAHGLGIVHRDLKPANVILVASGDETTTRVKLLDFGLAKELLADGNAKDAPLTVAGTVFGTPGYLSPEQAAGRKVDARADLYSLGVLLFEMACNRRLFDRSDPLDAVRDHLNTPPPEPRSINGAISPALSRVILKALEKMPEHRWSSAEELALALAATPEAGARGTEPIWQRRWRGRPHWQWGAAAAGALLLIVGLAVALRGRPATPAAAAPTAATASTPTRTSKAATHAEATPGAALPDGARSPDGSPRSAHLQRAVGYAHKLWCTDALTELDRALAVEPELRSRPEVARTAVACLRSHTAPRANRFLVERLGADARPTVEAAAAHEPSAEVRRNAQQVLERLPR